MQPGRGRLSGPASHRAAEAARGNLGEIPEGAAIWLEDLHEALAYLDTCPAEVRDLINYAPVECPILQIRNWRDRGIGWPEIVLCIEANLQPHWGGSAPLRP